MNEDTHPHIQIKRTVRALNRMVERQLRGVGRKQLATITATGPLTVTLDGATKAVPASYLPGYTPAVGDRVLVEVFSAQVVVFGPPLT